MLFQGRKEFGKTTLLNWYQERLEPRVLALDPFRDFKGLVQHADVDDAIRELNETDGPVRVALRPSLHEDTEAFANRVFGEVIAYVRNTLLVLDEITLWSGPESSDNLRKLVLQGRRLGIRMAIACQQIQLVPWVLMSQLTELVIFNTTRPQDVARIKDWVGPDVAERAKDLDQGEAFLVTL